MKRIPSKIKSPPLNKSVRFGKIWDSDIMGGQSPNEDEMGLEERERLLADLKIARREAQLLVTT